MRSLYKICRTIDEVKKVIRYCKKTKYCSLDYETSGGPFHSSVDYPTILGIAFQPGSAYIIPLGHFDSPFKNNYEEVLQLIGRELFEDPTIVKIAWNFKFEAKWTLRYGIKFKGICMDGMLAKYLLNEERPNDLKSMVKKYIPEFADYEEDYEGSHLPWDQKPLEGLSKYCGLDTDLTLRLMIWFESKLIETGLYAIFRNMLMMGHRVLAESEFNGMLVNKPYLEEKIEEYEANIAYFKNKMGNHPKLKRYEKARQEEQKEKLITKVQDEIYKLEEFIKNCDDEKVINRKRKGIESREDKISRYIAGEFTTKNELKVLEPVNLSSPNQLIELFFTNKKGFKFKIVKYTTDKFKRPTDRPSTDDEVLEKLQLKDNSGFIKALRDYRAITKLYSTYIKGIYELLSEDSKVHGTFLLHGTVTGRLSSQRPNLQNIPRDTTASDIKPMFIPPKGMLMLQLDYSQAELRVLAAQANETSMLEWFRTGKDIHLASACKKYNEEYEDIIKIYEDESHEEFKKWKIRRKQAKTINFGIVYGQGPGLLAESLSEPEKGIIVTKEEAKQFLVDFDKTFPKVAKHIAKQHKLVKKYGFVRNVFGRKRRLPNIFLPLRTPAEKDKNWGKIAEAQRQSVNAPIQGAASDYTLFSSVLIRKAVREGKLPSYLTQCYTVHDSLGFYIKPEDIHKAVPVLKAICKNPETQRFFGFQITSVSMSVDFEIGTNWGTLKNYDPNLDYTTWLEQ